MTGATLTISAGTTVVDILVDTDEEINTAINAYGTISNIIAVTTMPISNTKSKILVLYNDGVT